MNHRTVEQIQKEAQKFYKPSDSSIIEYVGAMTRDIENRIFFGKQKNISSEELLDGTIGGIFADLKRRGLVKNEDIRKVNQVVNARIHYNFSNPFVSTLRNVGYMATIANPLSAITQIGDLGFSAWKNGMYALPGTGVDPGVTRSDVHLDRASAEFEKAGHFQDVMNKAYKWSGFDKMDAIGKNNLIAGWMRKIGAQSLAKFESEIVESGVANFIDDVAKVHNDIKNGRKTDDVRFLAFQHLSNFQPISMSEMPMAYLRNPNGRILYMLKSFTIKQIDIVRRETIQKIDRGDVAGGLFSLTTLAAAFTFAGATADEIKDFILGREMKFRENVMNNFMKFMVLGRYHSENLRDPKNGVIKKLVYDMGMSFPTLDLIDRGYNTGADVLQGVQRGDQSIAETLGKGNLVEMIPVVGKLYYWREGAGVEKSVNKTYDLMREESLENSRQMSAERDKLVKIPEDQRTETEKDRLRHISNLEGTHISGLRSKYGKIMKEAIAAKDYNLAEVAHKQILQLQSSPSQALEEARIFRKERSRSSGRSPSGRLPSGRR
jgi:hypothetical protein